MLNLLDEALAEYNTRYNTTFIHSDLWLLFPTSKEQYGFHGQWPHGDYPGVYVIFDKDMNIIYVGVASPLGRRLYDHFRGGQECVFTENWNIPPYALVTIPVDKNASWERLSLEEFLIQKFNPAENTRGKIK